MVTGVSLDKSILKLDVEDTTTTVNTNRNVTINKIHVRRSINT